MAAGWPGDPEGSSSYDRSAGGGSGDPPPPVTVCCWSQAATMSADSVSAIRKDVRISGPEEVGPVQGRDRAAVFREAGCGFPAEPVPRRGQRLRLLRLPEGLLVVVELDVLLVAELDGEVESEVPIGALHELEARPPAAQIPLQGDELLAELARVKIVGRRPVQVPVRRGAEVHRHVHLLRTRTGLRQEPRERRDREPPLVLRVGLDGSEDAGVRSEERRV